MTENTWFGYQAERIDRIILQTARMIFRRIETSPREVAIDLRMKTKVVQLDMAKKDIKGKIEKSKRELDVLGEEISKCLLGESRFTDEMLSQTIDRKKQELAQLKKQQQEIIAEARDQQKIMENLSGYYDRFTSWAEEFEAAPMERKRMIMSELFSRIEVDRGYEVKIEVALNYKQFLENALPQTRIAV